MEVLVLGWPERFQSKVIDDEQCYLAEVLHAAIVRAHRLRGAQAGHQLGLGNEQHVMALARCGMPQGLRKVALACAAGPGDEHRNLFFDETAGGQVMDCGAVQSWQAVEVETVERFLVAEVGAPHAQRKFLLVATGDLVMNEQAQEFGEGQLAVDGFAVARLQRVEDAGQAQLLEQGSQFWNWMHIRSH